ncbi:glycoside hydrolase family 15 protein [Lichenifustis flavocetrariae]|uniref:Glycoside hydrolase family 15 protein n=1 Tax=Lichenifustis flavocetrariae TaxID=2949735 RepID=A0AA41YTC3_9HYPH|nr:glycoside hydrolase family 15 protein [Lichenifustis flavocetrariae]MCW6508211.1 glycoside hydrolase family 15 protein [Lichenifustis flavocetrariae]
MSRKPPGNLDYALIGNCRIAAMVDPQARIVWWCMPRFDSDPVFSRLLAGDEEKGFCDVVLKDQVASQSAYVRNTAIVETILTDSAGARVRITDFVPRFRQFDRLFRPAQIFRRIEPLSGIPRITIRVRPTYDYGREVTEKNSGSSHVRYIRGGGVVVRLSTDAPLSYIEHETAFALTHPVTMVFGQDEPFLSAFESTGREFLEKTRDYWLNWVRYLALPYEWQTAVTRAAITLKLCQFEETGAIIAAHTTSIPEAPGSIRNWDYRYCWLRDAFFVVHALNRLGATQTMEDYITYLTNIAVENQDPLSPLHGIVPGTPLNEWIAPHLDGFQNNKPVRVGNAAATQAQHDVYGSVVLAVTQMYVDERLPKMGDEALFRQLEPLGRLASKYALQPDAGIWEFRGFQKIHTYSATLCWVACDRLARIAKRLGLRPEAESWAKQAANIKSAILAQGWNEERQALTGAFGSPDLDASVLLVTELGLISPNDHRYVKTVEAIGRELTEGGRIMRYTAEDDFGKPETNFLVCNFWYVDALAQIGRMDEARERFLDILSHRNAYGILSEDLHPVTGELWGNFPQTYSMAGIINSAMRLSRSWEDAWCLDL